MLYSTATFSPDRVYRYSLTRQWGEGDFLMVVGLNASTADEVMEDPTIRRVIGFGQAWGFGGLYMLNIFAYRTRDPKVLSRAADPIGPRNNAALLIYADMSVLHVAAWGTHGALLGRGDEVKKLLVASGHTLYHLGLTREGHPRHPLYLSKTTKPEVWV